MNWVRGVSLHVQNGPGSPWTPSEMNQRKYKTELLTVAVEMPWLPLGKEMGGGMPSE